MKTQKERNKYLAAFEAGCFYHVYNRTNNKEKLFFTDADRHHFLSKYWQYLPGYLHTYTYCLLDNHFHFLVQVKSAKEMSKHISMIRKRDRTVAQNRFLESREKEVDMHLLISSQFNRFFTAYAMYFNKVRERHGNLFHRPFKRLIIKNEGHFTHAVFYIHANPVKHGLISEFKTYPWSSYQMLVSDQPTRLKREMIMNWFGGRETFQESHDQDLHLDDFGKWGIED